MTTRLLLPLLLLSCRDTPKDDTPLDTDTGVPPGTDSDGDGFASDVDCDDSDPAIYPGAAEACDGLDNNCSGEVDEGLLITWFPDEDGDGFGDESESTEACVAPADHVENGRDCNDLLASVNPDAEEICDGIDNDCNGFIDEDEAVDAETWYRDVDLDGWGVETDSVVSCAPPPGYALGLGDCDDSDPAFHPGAIEADCADPNDYNCDGSVGFADADADGFAACEDCDDADANANEDAIETCDGVDNDCDGLTDSDDPDTVDTTVFYGDSDGDGYGGTQYEIEACEAAPGYVATDDDCDDLDAASHPGASEICDGADNDCDNDVDEGVGVTWYEDNDSDGYGNGSVSAVSCDAPTGYVGNALDCDDFNAATNPGSYEICDQADNDCDGSVDEDAINATVFYVDGDLDGYGSTASSTSACDAPTGYADNDSDCNDADPAVNPLATEFCDSVDNDCDGVIDESDAADANTWYQDLDSDGFGNSGSQTTSCAQPSGYVTDSTDCDDTAASTNTQGTELCDLIDNDCDGEVDEDDAADAQTWYQDSDLDGYGTASSTATACSVPSGYSVLNTDCDDSSSSVNPSATETWYDGVDSDCAGDDDNDADGDGATSYLEAGGPDCDDFDASVTDCGSNANTALASCDDLLTSNSSLADGDYWIDPDGGSAGNAFQAYCDMTTNGGGWTLVANVAPTDGNVLGYPSGFWYDESEYGSLGNRFAQDFKSPAAYLLQGTHLMIQSTDTGAAGGIRGWKRWPFNTTQTFDALFYDGTQVPYSCSGSMYSCDTQNSDASDVGSTSQWDGIIRKGSCLYADINTESNNDVSRLVSSLGSVTSCVSNRMGGFGTYINGQTPGMDRGDCGPAAGSYYGDACHWSTCAEPGTENPDCGGGHCGAHNCENHVSDFTWNSRFYVR